MVCVYTQKKVLSPQASYISRASWMTDESRGATRWTQAENKIFESALALHDKDTPDRFHKVAEMLPGKTVGDVIKQYKELVDDVSNIEAGLVPIPGYDCNSCSSFTLEWVNHAGYKQAYCPGGKRGPPRSAEQERKKGVPWTEEEHRLFLMGLNKYGKGDWRNISRNFVVSRTPTQVASHAQKYFIRQLSGAKDKRRASIHDITTVTLESQLSPSPDNKSSNSPQQTAATIQSQKPCSAAANAMPGSTFQWDEPSNNITGGGAAAAGFSYNTTSTYQQGHAFISPYGLQSYPQNLQRGGW